MGMTVHHQNFMLSVRQQMGWPSFRPANNCIGWSSGQDVDFEVGMEIARIAQMVGKDLIYTGWASTRAKDPTSFAVAYREMLNVDIVDRLVPYAVNDHAPIILVSTRADEFFAIDSRGSLVRMDGKPKGMRKGKALAMKRIKAAAATMRDELLANNAFVAPGAEWIEPEAPLETIVQFR